MVESLRHTYVPTPFVPPVELGTPTPPPQWKRFEPPAPTGFGRLFRSAYEQKVVDARAEFAAAQNVHQENEASRTHWRLHTSPTIADCSSIVTCRGSRSSR